MDYGKPVVLILEDDVDLADELGYAIQRSGYDPVLCKDVASFWSHVARREVDIIIADIGLPDGYGVDVVREVRSQSDVPIISTSGHTDIEDRVAGIEVDADDYLAQPYNLREVTAKLSRLLTRTKGTKYSKKLGSLKGQDRLMFEGFELRLDSMALTSPEGEDIPLTTYEFLLLKTLAERPKSVLSRSSLIDLVHQESWFGSERTVDNLVSRIRTKLAKFSNASIIKTVRGMGYVFTADTSRKDTEGG